MPEVKDESASEDKTCPKCGSRMLSDKTLGSGAIGVSLIRENEFRGDDVKTFYCRKCGYMELYRVENRRRPYVSVQELFDFSEEQE
jgi:predicted nucleic-acid-binding Zn-ribbon protein